MGWRCKDVRAQTQMSQPLPWWHGRLTGEDAGQEKAEDRRRGREGSQTQQGSVRAAASRHTHSGASSHTPDTWELHLSGWLSWAQWQRSLCQKPTGRALNSSCEKRNVCFPSLLESYRGRRKAGVCPFTSFHLFHSLPWNLRASKGTPTTGYDFLENYPGYLPNPTGLRFGSAVWAVCPSRLRDSLSHVPLSLRGEGCPP